MPRRRSWSDAELAAAVESSYSYRQVIKKLGLVPAGGNYSQTKHRIIDLSLNTDHFTGRGWNTGSRYRKVLQPKPLREILVNGSRYQSYKLRNRLFREGLKKQSCEECGWAEKSVDGRIPVELDHINGDRYDNRLKNLRILCPNCHSLKPTHRAKNRK